jgi:hypothetical protein
MILIVYAYGTVLVLKGKSGDDSEVLIGLGVILTLVLLSCAVVLIMKKFIPDRRSKTLTGMEVIIQDRLEELNLAMQKLDSIRPLISNRENKVGNVAIETLENASTILNHMQQEYHTTLWKIEILRLLNRYEAVKDSINESVTVDFVSAQESIIQLNEDCTRLKQHHIDSVNGSSSSQVIEQLKNISDLIDNLRDSVIAGQISRTVQQIHPLRSYHRLQTLKPQIESQIEFVHQFDNLTAEFGMLENENIRLKSEQEILESINENVHR